FPFVNIDGTVFFSGFDHDHGLALWKSDGTDAGTLLVKDIDPVFHSGYPSSWSLPTHWLSATNWASMGGNLYFEANDPAQASSHGLWKSDGTNAGTVLVKGFASDLKELTRIGNNLFFTASDGVSDGLWRSDGTSDGTIRLTSDVSTNSLTDLNGTLYFDGY